MWHRLYGLKQDPDGQIVGEIEFPEESQWFAGHFPGDPLVPAVAQLTLVREALSRIGSAPFAITGLQRIKFKAMVRPGDRLRLQITPRDDSGTQYGFRLVRDQDLVGSGIVTGRFAAGDTSAAPNR